MFQQMNILFPNATGIAMAIAKHTKVDMIWVAGRSPTLVSHSLRGVAMHLKATTLTYLAIGQGLQVKANVANFFEMTSERHNAFATLCDCREKVKREVECRDEVRDMPMENIVISQENATL